jgi:non-ribosomal peptide synthetase component F
MQSAVREYTKVTQNYDLSEEYNGGEQMALEVYIHSNNGWVVEIPDHSDEVSTNNNQQLSLEEFEEIANRLADKFMKFVGPDFQPLSDYAISRESIYEDHP